MPLDYEKKLYSKKIHFIVGTDEAGRGPLAGPVVAAAVIFPCDYSNDKIDDSKKLSDKKRRELFIDIKKRALAYAIVEISAEKIDEINILEASRLAMTEAIKKLNHSFDLIISDAMKLPNFPNVVPLVKADAQVLCVAAASILAKVTRDDIMIELDKKYPQFNFKKNKGYPTKDHIESLKLNGPIKGIHRFSYRPVIDCSKKQLTLF